MTNITAMFRTRYAAAVPLLMLLVAIAAGCSSVSDEEFERRVQEEVGRQLAEREAKVVGITLTPTPRPTQVPPTATPIPTPTPSQVPTTATATDLLGISTSWPTIKDGLEADYRVLVTALWGKYCKTASSCYSPIKEIHLGYFNQYIATYVASECVAGGKLTTKGFRYFLGETVDPVKLRVLAGDTLHSMNALAEGRIKAGLTPVTDVCQRLILYPESGLEIALAQGLYSAIVLPNIPIHLRDAVLAGLDSDFGGWLLVEDNQQKTIFQWFCNSIPARCGDLLKWRTGTPEASDKNGDEAQSK